MRRLKTRITATDTMEFFIAHPCLLAPVLGLLLIAKKTGPKAG
jgi:hypothetical protein